MKKEIMEFYEKFDLKDLTIIRTKHWTWSLRPHQVTLGSGVLSLNRECSSYSDLSLEEHCDLGNMIKIIENTLSFNFKYEVMNYLMLMLVDSQVHYHVIPRYKASIKFGADTWVDQYWPKPPVFTNEVTPKDKLLNIVKLLKDNLIKE
ncbi:hypothetical protein [Exiguobacterium aurantiacum]|uniref:hypothetical protein n=1 Tax=Exiguobacterium aurantiacum TaxID=33987 RepID=UPI00384CA59C